MEMYVVGITLQVRNYNKSGVGKKETKFVKTKKKYVFSQKENVFHGVSYVQETLQEIFKQGILTAII